MIKEPLVPLAFRSSPHTRPLLVTNVLNIHAHKHTRSEPLTAALHKVDVKPHVVVHREVLQ